MIFHGSISRPNFPYNVNNQNDGTNFLNCATIYKWWFDDDFNVFN